MNAVGEYWKTLGQRLEAGLNGKPPAGDAFAELATTALHELPAPRMSATAIADWVIDEGRLPEQVNFQSSFGEPPLVVYETNDFYLEVLFWFPGRTAIHGHGFSGAFVVLDGLSIQTEFAFHQRSQPEEGVRLGTLEPRSIEFIEPGKVCTISEGEQFIHTVAHLGNPSLTLVVRTYGGAKRQQYRYHRCGFAALSGRAPLIVRQADVLSALHDGSPQEFPGRLVGLLERLNDYRFFTVLVTMLGTMRGRIFGRDVMPVIEAEFVAKRPDAVAAVRESLRTSNIWASARTFTKLETQVQCALADVFPNAAEREAVLCRSYGVASVSDLPPPWGDLVGGRSAAAAQPA